MNYSDFDYNLTAINADGIYLATYSALLLSFQLMATGHYENAEVREDNQIEISNQFMCKLLRSTDESAPFSDPIKFD